MEMRTSEEIPELSICGTPFKLITTFRPPSFTMDCSASFSCSLGSPMVRRPLDHQQMNAVLLSDGNLHR